MNGILPIIVLTAGMVLITALAVTLAVLVVSRVLRQNKELVEMALVEQKQMTDARQAALQRQQEKKKREFEKLRLKDMKDKAKHAEEDSGFAQPTHMM